jgi:hypothetical protein
LFDQVIESLLGELGLQRLHSLGVDSLRVARYVWNLCAQQTAAEDDKHDRDHQYGYEFCSIHSSPPKNLSVVQTMDGLGLFHDFYFGHSRVNP